MNSHVIEIGVAKSDEPDDAYFWRCSCGRTGPLQKHPWWSRKGGAIHVAAMERGR